MLSPVCPINLMGRDLMMKLGIILSSTPDGVQVTCSGPTMVDCTVDSLLYVYQWRIPLFTARRWPEDRCDPQLNV